jgi:hypothetical protein
VHAGTASAGPDTTADRPQRRFTTLTVTNHAQPRLGLDPTRRAE